ncbi:hypothetical protein [Mumia sp. ZJ430]|uniref:hypothetical protein n=1 Tax=Mumia sp. ZJ430 TaxID=2708083 RepID=UPI001421EB86|nr:hypothetical protein [Mumia sp. ZJ430]
MAKQVTPAILPPLREALTLAFWYKPDLRRFLDSCLPDHRGLVAQLDWSDYKRNIVGQLIDTLYVDQHKYFDALLTLILSTADIIDPAHLKRLDDGDRKYADAVAALDSLRSQVEPYKHMRSEEEAAALRRQQDRERAQARQAVTLKLEESRDLFITLHHQEAQQRGYSLEKFLNNLFGLYDIDAKGPFRVVGEQIDGAFTFEGTEFLLEAKWRAEKTGASDLDAFAAKISRKLDNTLGLFLSMNGYHDTAVSLHSQNRPVMILMDGADLSTVVEDRIPLPDLLHRKRQHAARTGEILLGAHQML